MDEVCEDSSSLTQVKQKEEGVTSNHVAPSAFDHHENEEDPEAVVDEDDMCAFDWAMLVEPVTLFCGHTFCRHCSLILAENSKQKKPTTKTFPCPLCSQEISCDVPQPNIWVRNKLRIQYPELYEERLEESKRCLQEQQMQWAEKSIRTEEGGGEAFRQREDIGNFREEQLSRLVEQMMKKAWRTRRPATVLFSLVLMFFLYKPLRDLDPTTRCLSYSQVSSIPNFTQWYKIKEYIEPTQCDTDVCEDVCSQNMQDNHVQYMRSVYFAPSLGWLTSMSRLVSVDLTKIIKLPFGPPKLFYFFPTMETAVKAYSIPDWSPAFQEATVFYLVDAEVRLLLAVYVFVLTNTFYVIVLWRVRDAFRNRSIYIYLSLHVVFKSIRIAACDIIFAAACYYANWLFVRVSSLGSQEPGDNYVGYHIIISVYCTLRDNLLDKVRALSYMYGCNPCILY